MLFYVPYGNGGGEFDHRRTGEGGLQPGGIGRIRQARADAGGQGAAGGNAGPGICQVRPPCPFPLPMSPPPRAARQIHPTRPHPNPTHPSGSRH